MYILFRAGKTIKQIDAAHLVKMVSSITWAPQKLFIRSKQSERNPVVMIIILIVVFQLSPFCALSSVKLEL